MRQVALYLLLAPLIGCGTLAVSTSSPWWTHLTYMLGHANVLHYGMNLVGWVLMWPILTPARTVTAILLAALLPATDVPVLGWSVVLYYYLGLCLGSMPKGDRIRMLLCVLAGFFIPWIAAWHHAAMLAAGWLLRKVERKWERTMR